jgi:hypothetical protein
MVDLEPKGEGDNSMPLKQRSCQVHGAARCKARVIWRKLNCLIPNLQTMERSIRRKAPGTGATPCADIDVLPAQPLGLWSDAQ